ncbi:hypothetical protein [Blastomonas sp.]|uniref:hypothetical protein n=1 Tax=Blastomonas sp. TaxID=1909299 RepID=UPI0026017C7E|nr:hypothetical protein [Blastomonas sp.]MDM7957506.1 hypothetical protein [Blastomonas sp.]
MVRLVMAIAALMMACVPAHAASENSARSILERAVEAAGGEAWLNPTTLYLAGSAVFYAPDSAEPRATADDYRMWRAMNPDRTTAHGADGKVRITAKSGGRLMFEVGYDGSTTWTEQGVMPKDQADAYWASNFGFGIIREALGEGFRLERAPDRNVGGHPIALIRVISPDGGATLFGIDTQSHYIRYMGFTTPRGFHERHYDDFITLPSGWVQAREVTLFYNGVKANTVFWREVRVGEPIAPALFAPQSATVAQDSTPR